MKKIYFLALALLISLNLTAQKNQKSGVIIATEFHKTRPIREIFTENPVDESKLYREENEESEDRLNRKPQKFKFSVKDGSQFGNDEKTVQRQMGDVPGLPVRANWVGQTTGGLRPYDPSGAVGPNHYVQMINSTTFKVYDKSSGSVLLTGTLGNLWSPATGNAGDPIVMYDKAADRWFLAQFGTSTDKKIYIAVSQTGDPTGAYYTYTFVSPLFPDYLKFGVWADGYYMTSNQGTQKVFAFNRAEILAGTVGARSIYVNFSPPKSGFFCPLPGDAADGTLPVPGTPCPIFSYSDNGWGAGYSDAVNIYQMSVDWTPAVPTGNITLAANLPTAVFDASYDINWNDCPQPGTTQKLDGIGGACMYRAQWKNWNGYNTILLNWGVKINASQRGIKWCELRQNQSNGTWSIYQEGIYAPDAATRWLGSMAMDNYGSIGLSYIKSDSISIYPGLYYTGRRACDPLGTLPVTETVVVAGGGSQTGINRVGDYSQTTLDMDGVTFWSTSEFMGGPTGSGAAKTRIFSYQINPCGNVATVAIAVTGGTNPGCLGNNLTFTATPTNGGTTPAYQWKVNGVNVGTNSDTYSSTSLTNGQVVTCVMTSNLPNVLGNPATSNAITLNLSALTTPSLSIAITSGSNPTCPGVNLTFAATATNVGATPTYQWKVNGANVGSNSPTYSTPNLTNGQIVSCVVTTTLLCSTSSTATSNAITVNVGSTTTPTVSITQTSGSNPFCEGSSVSFTATATNATNPVYNWMIDGVNAGTNSSVFSTSALTNNQVVSCQLSAQGACPLIINLGNGAGTNSTSSDLGAAYPTYYGNGRQQYLVLASELASLGVTAGNITNIAFNVAGTTGNPSTLNGYTIKLGATSAPSMSTTFQTPAFTTVFGPVNYTPSLNSWNTHTFNTPYYWNGTSNILVDICFSNSVTGMVAYQNAVTPTSFISTAYYQADGAGGAGACNISTATTTGQSRPTMKFTKASAPSVVTSNSIIVNTNPVANPSVSIALTGGNNPSNPGDLLTFSATAQNGGATPSYQWMVDGVNVGSNSDIFSTNNLTDGQVVSCQLTSSLNCANPSSTLSNSITIQLNTFVTPAVSIILSNGSNPACSSSVFTFTATPTNGGVPSYQWKVDGINAGTDSSSFTVTGLTDGQVVTCDMTSSLPFVTQSLVTSNPIAITIYNSFPTSITISLTNGTIPTCAGSPLTFTASAINGGTPYYQWMIDGQSVGSNSATFTTNSLIDGQVVSCTMTSSIGCADPAIAVSNNISVSVNQAITPSVSIVLSNGTNPMCAGSSVTFNATPISGGTPIYQWKIDGVNVGTNDPIFSTTNLADGQIVMCEMTSSESCVTNQIVASNSISMEVNSNVTPTVTIAITNGTNPSCDGSSITFNANITNGGNPTFQWKLDGINVGTNDSVFSSNLLTNGQMVTCEMTSTATCVTSASASSNTIMMTINPIVTPGISIAITGGSNPVCAGYPVTFTATPVNGGTPIYQWQVNGINTGTNNPAFTSSSLSDNDIVTCIMTSGEPCANPSFAISNPITMMVNNLLIPSVNISITSGNNPTCAGSPISFTAVTVNAGIPSYQWKVNGVNAGTNSANFTINSPVNGSTVSCEITPSSTCTALSTANSNTIIMTVNPVLTPSVNISITGGSNPACAGSAVTFSASATNGGTSPIFQWYENGVSVGNNSTTYTTNTLTTGKVITCQLTSSNACSNPAIVISNGITMTINPTVTPSVSIAITSGTNPACAGSAITFTATPLNGGTPSYQWKVNGVNAGTNNSAFTSSTLANNNIVTCVMTSNAACLTSATATSNAITRLINPTVTPSVSIAITSGTNPTCSSVGVTFTATPVNGGPTPSYQWKVSGVNAGTNSPVFTSTTLTNNKIVTCVMTTSAPCATAATATSNGITMSVTNSVTPTISIAITSGANPMCAGSSVTYKATITNGGTPVYQWKVNGVNVGTNSSTYATTTITNGQVVTCTLTSSATCAIPNVVTSNSITMTVNPVVTPAVSMAITSGNNPNCSGSPITFTATPVNGGTAPSYQWKSGNTNVGTNSPIFTSSTLTNGKVIKCVMTSNATCKTANTATSNSITMVVSNTLVPSVSIAVTGGGNPFCPGSLVTLTATPVNGGIASYQWKINGVNAGTNNSSFATTSLIGGQIITCVMTSSLSCANPVTATSNAITMVAGGCAPVHNQSGAPSLNPDQTIVACDLYTWPVNGITYAASGNQVANFTNVAGFDSSYVLHLTINHATNSYFSIQATQAYTWPVNNVTYSSTGLYNYIITNQQGCDSVITLDLTINNDNVQVGAKAILAGPYDMNERLMQDSLRVKNLIPHTEPYSDEPYNFPQITEQGGETVSSEILAVSGKDAIVDWVYVELRSAINPSVIVATKRALIQRDGDIVSSTDGVSPVRFIHQKPGNYYVSIKHRNHLGVMSAKAWNLNSENTLIDFTSHQNVWTDQKITSNPPLGIAGDINVLIAGNSDADKIILFNKNQGDCNFILTRIGVSRFNNTLNGYSSDDLNMDAKLRYMNTDNDKDVILKSVGGLKSRDTILHQHIPE